MTAASAPAPVRAAVRLGIGIVLLWLVQLSVSSLPMLNDAIPFDRAYVTYATLVGAGLKTAIFILVWRFAAEVRKGIGVAMSAVSELGRMAQQAVWLLIIALAYVAYTDVATALHLRGLKENVTMGRLIPAGTGFEWYRHVRIPPDEPPPPPQPTEGDLDVDREIEYAFNADEPLAGTRGPVGDVE